MVFMYHPSDTQTKLFFFVVLALQSIWDVENAAQHCWALLLQPEAKSACSRSCNMAQRQLQVLESKTVGDTWKGYISYLLHAERFIWSESCLAATSHHCPEEASLALPKAEPWINALKPLHLQHITHEHALLDFTPRIWHGKVRQHSTSLLAKAIFHTLYSHTATINPRGRILSSFEKHNTFSSVLL